ncbi:hypothetical protein D3C71_1391640 [compost metagenome]
MAIPSSTAMVLNSLATPPEASICSATSLPKSRRCTWPGTNWVKELTTAIMGLPKSSSVIPVARHNARAPAMLRPWVVVAERYLGMLFTPNVFITGGERTAWIFLSVCRFTLTGNVVIYGFTGSSQPYLSSVLPVNRPKNAC